MPPPRGEGASGAPARVRVHGEFLRMWESSSPLSDDAADLCARLEQAVSTSRRGPAAAAPAAAADRAEPSAGEDCGARADAYAGVEGLSVLSTVTTVEEFHAWHAEMERRLKEANDEKFHAMLAGLTSDRHACAALLGTVDGAAEALAGVKRRRALVADTTDRFRADCETLVAERTRMGELADALRRRLTYFEELETLTVKFGTGKDAITPTHPDFVKLLHRLDECVAYASSSSGAVAEADGYVARFLEVQRRAFTIARDYTVGLIKSTATQVAKELKEERAAGAGFRHADLTDASKEYLRFRTIAPRVKSLMSELQDRSKAPPAKFLPYNNTGGTPTTVSSMPSHNMSGTGTLAGNPLYTTRSSAMSLYGDCEECFLDQRRRLLEPSVSAHVRSIAEVRNMIALARLGSTYVLRVCQLERQLHEHFFPNDGGEMESPALSEGLSGVCDALYTELRPQILQESELDKLVYLIEVLKTEILGDEVPRRGAAGIAFAPTAARAIADAQERIIYRAEVFLRDEVNGFVPDAGHLDYPERIIAQNTQRASVLASARAASSSPRAATVKAEGDAAPPSPSPSTNGAPSPSTSKTRASESKSVGIYSTWYPPVEKTLRLLSMLYRCVDPQVFAGLAQEAVALCVHSVVGAASRIATSGKPDAPDHAQLFLIWQLLMTREQISPFDVDMTYTEHELNFTELRELLGSVIRGQLSVRSLGTPPAVKEKVVNSRHELDHRVRTSCETFILKTTRTLLDPVLSFLAKCNAMPVRGSGGAHARGPDAAKAAVSAFDQLKANKGSFAHPARLNDMWNTVEAEVDSSLPEVVARMKLYITKPASRAVLLRPVRANVAEAATELLSALQARYSLEERAEAGIDGARVTQLLDKVDRVTDLTTGARRRESGGSAVSGGS